MRLLLIGTLGLALGCTSPTRSGFMVPPQPGLLRSCRSTPVGSNARIRLLVLSDLGDTLRTARVHLVGEAGSGAALTQREWRISDSTGVYDIGPLAAGKYYVSVADTGHDTAYMTARFCDSSVLQIQAVLASREAKAAP